MTLTDRINLYKKNNPDYNPGEDLPAEMRLRQEYNFPQEQYKWYQLAIAAAPTVGLVVCGATCLGLYLMYTPNGQEFVRTIFETIFK